MSPANFLVIESLSSAPIFLLAKMTAILAAAWITHLLLRSSNPRWRILVWRVSTVGLIGVVLLSLLSPLFTLRLLPAVSKTSNPTSNAKSPIASSNSAAPTASRNATPLPGFATKLPNKNPSALQKTSPSGAPASIAPMAASNEKPIQQAARPSWSLSNWLLFVWGIVVLLGLTKLVVGIVRVARICKSSTAVPDWIDSKSCHVNVRQTEQLAAPCSVGFFRYTILLPHTFCDKSHAPEIRAILAHEAAHLTGHDLRWNFVLHSLSVLLWFHPLAWRMRLAHADACDERCDAVAANCLQDTECYGRLLAKIALEISGQTPTTALPMARTSSIASRIRMMHSGVGIHRLPRWKRRTVSTLAAALLLFLGAAGVSRSTAKPTTEKPALADSGAAKPNETSKPNLSGRIVDETGAPVTDATISLTGKRREGDFIRNSYESKTDAKGYYTYEDIQAADTYRVRITSTKWVGLTNWKQLPQLQLSPESKMTRDFQLSRACSLRIRTVDEAGKPVKNVRIYSASLAVERWENSHGVSTDKEGWATIGALKPSATVYIFGTMNKNYAFAKLIKKLDDPNSQPEEVLLLTKGEDVSGTVLCSDGNPAAGWTINAMPDWWHFGASPRGAKIAEDGSFTLSHIVPGKYDITVGVPTGEGMTRVERARSDVLLPLNAGASKAGRLEIRLRIASPQSMAAITGKITTSGRPFQERVSVYARSENGSHRGSGSVMPGKSEFRISPLPSGRYTLTFSSTEIEQKKIPNVEAPSDDLEVELQVNGKPRLSGIVVHADTGKPLSRFRVRVLKTGHLRGPNYVQEPQWQSIENAQGEFAVDVVGPGIYRIVVAAENLANARSEPINTDEYQGKPITLKMGGGVTINGTVVNETGKPVDGATVTPLSQSSGGRRGPNQKFDGEEGSVKTTEGHFEFHNLPTGKEVLKVTHPDYNFAMSSEIEIGTDDLQLKPIVLTSGGTVSGHVYDSNGQPDANVTLYIQDQSGRTRFATAVTDQKGYYEAHHLPEQLCDIVREQQWNDLGVVVAAILPVNGESHRLDLGGKQAVTGRLLVNGKPLRNVKVQLGGENPSFAISKAFAQTDAEGAFTFWGPADGRRFLYYAAPESRNDWIRAGKVFIEATTQYLGTIDVRSTSLAVAVTGLPEKQAAEARLSLIEYNPRWAHGNKVGVLAPRPQPSDPFVFSRVPPGTYELISRRSDHLTLRKVIEIETDDLADTLRVSLDWPTTTGTLAVEMDKSIYEARRYNPPNLWSEDSRIHGKLRSPDGKTVRFENLPAGKYYLAEHDTRDPPRVLEFSVKAGETTDLSLTTESYKPEPLKLGMLVVRCYTENGVPLTGCKVTIANKTVKALRNSAHRETQTFTGDPGDYAMTVSFPGYQTVTRQVELVQVAPGGEAVGNFRVDLRLALE